MPRTFGGDRATIWRPARAVALAAAATALVAAGALASAQRPASPQPALQCPAGTPSCTYTEKQLALEGYRYQMMVQSGGADWDTELWVSDPQGQALLAVPPTRGNAWLAVRQLDAGPSAAASSVRVVADYYAPTDPAVAPSGFASTIYDYDAARGALVAQTTTVLPRSTPEQLRDTLRAEGWTIVLPAE